MAEQFSINEIAKELGLAETTARRYADIFFEFLPSRKYGRITKYDPEAINILHTISELYKGGHSTEEIKVMLQEQIPRTIDIQEQNKNTTITPPQAFNAFLEVQAKTMQQLAAAFEEMADQEEKINQLTNEVKVLKEELESSKIESKKELAKRDQALIQTMRSMVENKKPWWKKIFRK